MAHLLDYENAASEQERAFAALDCADAKSASAAAWNWADVAVEHAISAGLCTLDAARQSAGNRRRPDTGALRMLFKAGSQ